MLSKEAIENLQFAFFAFAIMLFLFARVAGTSAWFDVNEAKTTPAVMLATSEPHSAPASPANPIDLSTKTPDAVAVR